MKRLTSRTAGDIYVFEDGVLESGEAAGRLAAFENAYEEILSEQAEYAKQLEVLRNQGKKNSVKFKEILGKKMMNLHTILLFERHGIK